MSEPGLSAGQPRPARWYRLAMATVVLDAVAVLGGSGWRLFDGRYVDGYSLPEGAIPIGDRDVCANTVTVMVGTDTETAVVARALRGDPESCGLTPRPSRRATRGSGRCSRTSWICWS
ncbi:MULTISPECIES: hypothetical protein [Amycolatopsis]|uniref:Uncharacterized protein n=1 Tax=Amycolatopsis albidoflavus TaxID=102226 RepID=A0ABW5HXG7_9PSEU